MVNREKNILEIFREIYEEGEAAGSTIGDADIAKAPAKIGKKILKKEMPNYSKGKSK